MKEPESRVSSYQPITELNIARSDILERLSKEQREDINAISKALPFRTNEYIVRELIDWSRASEDPIYQMTFAQREMLNEQSYSQRRTTSSPTLRPIPRSRICWSPVAIP